MRALRNHPARVSPLAEARRYPAELNHPGVRTKSEVAVRFDVSRSRVVHILNLLSLDTRVVDYLDCNYGDPKEEDSEAAARGEDGKYRQDTDRSGEKTHHASRFAFCAYPAEYGPRTRRTFIVNEKSQFYWRDVGGKAVRTWPRDADLSADWRKLE